MTAKKKNIVPAEEKVYAAPEDNEEVNSELVGKRQTIKSIIEISSKREGAMRNKNRATHIEER